MQNPVVTAKSIRWDCGFDGISIDASYVKKSGEWVYVVFKGKTAITPKIKSDKAPDENSPRGRDQQIKAALNRQKKHAVDADAILRSLFDFSLTIGNTPSMIADYIDPNKRVITSSSSKIVSKAIDVLKNGDPIKYLLKTFESMHKGDYDTAKVLLISVATQSILNSDGIQPTLSGESGKGKSHVCKTILHLIPKEYWLDTSLSGKAPFYMDLKPGTIIFSDDSTIGEDLESAIKRSTSGFQDMTAHTTVDKNRSGTTLLIPQRVAWWLSNVDSDLGMQMINRQFGVTVDETEKMDIEVRDFQLKKAKTAILEFPVTEEVLVCREIMRIIKDTNVLVAVPFSEEIKWTDTSNRRNLPIFLDMIMAFAMIRIKQRVLCAENTIEATTEDFDDAYELYRKRAGTQTTKLNDFELKLVTLLSYSDGMDTSQLQTAMDACQTKIHNVMHGRNKNAGLLSKVPGLTREKASVKVITDDGMVKTVQKNIYTVRGFNQLENYASVVSLKIKKDKSTIKNKAVVKRVYDLMNEFKPSEEHYNTERGFRMVLSKLEDAGFTEPSIKSAISKYKKEHKL